MRIYSLTLLSAFFSVILLLGIHGFAQESKMRTWTSSKGTTLEAELVEYQDGVAKLRNKEGKTLNVKTTQLSQADQVFLNSLSKETPAANVSGSQNFEVIAVTVAKPLPAQENHNHALMTWSDGITISLLVKSNDLAIINLDDEASTLTSFTDEKKNDLMKETGPQKRRSMFRTTEPVSCRAIDEDGAWALVDLHAPNIPAAGSKTVTIKGEVALRAGSGSVIAAHKDIDLSGKGQFKAGNATITVKKEDSDMGMMGENFKMRITLESQDAVDTIKEFTFFNSRGDEIEYQYAGSGYMGDTNVIYFMLAEDVKTLTIKTDAYEKIKTIRIPVSLETGIGF